MSATAPLRLLRRKLTYVNRKIGSVSPTIDNDKFALYTAQKILFCCVRFIYTYLTIQVRCSVLDPTPPFVQAYQRYVHIPYAPFVALEIIGGAL